MHRLKLIFSCLSSAGLQLNRKKCHFVYQEIKVLGHVISTSGISPDPNEVKAVTEFPVPKTLKNSSFVGLASYFRRFVRSFASIAAPLTMLLRKDISFKWTPDCAQAFSRLKGVLTSPPVLRHYHPRAPVALHTDASGEGIGVLAQRSDDAPMEYAVAYASPH